MEAEQHDLDVPEQACGDDQAGGGLWFNILTRVLKPSGNIGDNVIRTYQDVLLFLPHGKLAALHHLHHYHWIEPGVHRLGHDAIVTT